MSVRRTRSLLAVLAGAIASLLLIADPATAAATPPPNSMASMGDSITRGFNACGWYVDCTVPLVQHRQHAASTATTCGSAPEPGHQRPQLQRRAVRRQGRRHARPGADRGRAGRRVRDDADRRQRRLHQLRGVDDLGGHVPGPDRHRAGHARGRACPTPGSLSSASPTSSGCGRSARTSSRARTAWACSASASRCWPTRPPPPQADVDRRDRVRQRVVDFNAQLAQACAAYGPNCAFDDNAVFNYPFALSQVSTWDYFHPNTSGQTVLASVSYAAGFNW